MKKARKKWWVLLVTTSGTSLVFLDNTVMPVALPTIQSQLGFSSISLVWVVNAYLLALTSFLLIGGRLCDLFGKRVLYAVGLCLFGGGSWLAGMAFYKWMILLGRVIQGMGGSLIVPTTSALLISTFPEGERAKAIGINTGISSLFMIMGPAVGGVLTQYLSWRSIFFLNIPLVAFGLVTTFWILQPGKRRHEPFHFLGALTMMVAVITLVVGLMQANDWGWTSPATLSLLGLSPFFFFLFYWISVHIDHPIIDFHLFKKRLFTVANISIFLTQVVVMITVLWAIYFQEQLNFSIILTGLIIFTAVSPVFLMAPLGGFVADRYGPRIPMLTGFSILTFALFWLLFTINVGSIPLMLPGLLGFGCGIPLIMSPTVALGLSQAPREKLGAASGITTETRQLAATIGIALLSSVYYTTEAKTGSHAYAFTMSSFVAGLFAFGGVLLVLFGMRGVRSFRG
ncbi:MAG: Multidrug resistance protein Stp [Chlamydiae bacterium]|nr:Multidrug resistance protein Stp [Chlamydiota bacterium]